MYCNDVWCRDMDTDCRVNPEVAKRDMEEEEKSYAWSLFEESNS